MAINQHKRMAMGEKVTGMACGGVAKKAPGKKAAPAPMPVPMMRKGGKAK